jgi:hypothetical protein
MRFFSVICLASLGVSGTDSRISIGQAGQAFTAEGGSSWIVGVAGDRDFSEADFGESEGP